MAKHAARWIAFFAFLLTVAFQFVVIPLGVEDVVDYCRASHLELLQRLAPVSGFNVVGMVGTVLMFVAIVYPLFFARYFFVDRHSLPKE